MLKLLLLYILALKKKGLIIRFIISNVCAGNTFGLFETNLTSKVLVKKLPVSFCEILSQYRKGNRFLLLNC